MKTTKCLRVHTHVYTHTTWGCYLKYTRFIPFDGGGGGGGGGMEGGGGIQQYISGYVLRCKELKLILTTLPKIYFFYLPFSHVSNYM